MASDEVFRYVNVRPVQRVPEDKDKRQFASYDSGKRSPFHQAVAELPPEGARERAVELATRRLAVDDDPTLPPKVRKAVEKAARAKIAGEGRELIGKALDESPDAYLKGEDANKLTDAVWD